MEQENIQIENITLINIQRFIEKDDYVFAITSDDKEQLIKYTIDELIVLLTDNKIEFEVYKLNNQLSIEIY